MDKIIPNSLYLILSLLFGGIDMVHDGIEDVYLKRTVRSLVQDIVYAVCNRKKLTNYQSNHAFKTSWEQETYSQAG